MVTSKLKHIFLILAVVSATLGSTSCARMVKMPSIAGASVTDVTMNGLRSASAILVVDVVNPNIFSIDVRDISGTIYVGGTKIASFSADNVHVKRRSDGTYAIPVSGSLYEGVSTMQMLAMISKISIDDVTVDISAFAKAGPVKKTYYRQRAKVKDLIEGK